LQYNETFDTWHRTRDLPSSLDIVNFEAGNKPCIVDQAATVSEMRLAQAYTSFVKLKENITINSSLVIWSQIGGIVGFSDAAGSCASQSS
jgi:hypothetical protein